MEKFTCAFTGHRPKSFPWKYNETSRECVLLKDALAAQITSLAEQTTCQVWPWGPISGARRSSLICKRNILR